MLLASVAAGFFPRRHMSQLLPAQSLAAFFKTLLDEALAQARVDVGELTELYLANLLVEFTAADRLFCRDEGGEEPLAVLYCRADVARNGRHATRTLGFR